MATVSLVSHVKPRSECVKIVNSCVDIVAIRVARELIDSSDGDDAGNKS
jgi:hypothetical protein